MYSALRPEGLNTITLTLVQTKAFKQHYPPLPAMFLLASFPSWHLLIRTSFNTASTGPCDSRFHFPLPCSLINTLYVWFPASWAPMVAERLFGLPSNPGESSYPQHGQPASGLSQKQSGVHPWHQSRQEAAGSSGAMSDVDSTEVVYKIRQWSLPGAAVVPVLNVSSRVFWLELDDKALLDSYTVLQEGILCDVFSQKCSAAWQGAPGQRLTVAIMLPGRQDADDWLNFMLSQKNLWPTFTTRGTLTEEISDKTFRKERRRLQAKHLWMEVKLSWHVLADRMYTAAPTGKSREQLYALLFNKAARGSQKESL